jgi:uncharacterized protein (TIGR02246 family)
MSNDDQAIRDLIATWHRATAEGDLSRVLDLMTEDVVFLGPGRPPIRGRDQFAALARSNPAHFESQQEIQEVKVDGDWAYCWTQISVTATPPGGAPIRRSGPTLSIFRKQPDGRWRLARDANMLAVDATPA